MGWRVAGFKVGRFSRIGLAFGFFLAFFIFMNLILTGECLIRPTHRYYQTDRDKVSKWNCGT
ncbi:MAG TPA: hypothetical protein VGG61_04875 [Gemmataceae bacterium]